MKKRVLLLLSMLLLLFQTTTVFADITVTESDDNSVIDYTDGNGDTEVERTVQVTANKNSTFAVCVPKYLTLKSNSACEFKIGIFGDISETERIVVEPIDQDTTTAEIDFILTNVSPAGLQTKPDVNAVITPIKTIWLKDDADFCDSSVNIGDTENQITIGTILANVSAGQWVGNFTLRIALEDIPTGGE